MPVVQAAVVVIEAKTTAAEPECNLCTALRKAKGLANSVSEIATNSDGSKVLHCNICNSDRVVRRYDASLRQAENIAGPCPVCSLEKPHYEQRTRVYSKHGSVRFCECLQCKTQGRVTRWKRTP